MVSISLRLVMSVFITVTVVLTALIAFMPLYNTGLVSIRSTVDNIRDGLIRESTTTIKGFFNRAPDIVRQTSAATQFKMLDIETAVATNPDELNSWLCNMVLAANGTFNNALVKLFNRLGSTCDVRFNPTVTVIQRNGTHAVIEMMRRNATTGHLSRFMPPLGVVPLFTPPGLPSMGDSVVFLKQMSWSIIPVLSYDTSSFTFGAPVYSYTTGAPTGTMEVALLTTYLNTVLEDIGLRENGRAALIHFASGIIVGNSWNETNTEIYSMDQTLPREKRGKLKLLTDMQDSLIHKVLRHYGVTTIMNGTSFSATMGSTESEETFVDVLDITDPYGLHLRLIVAMPMKDFLGDFYTSRTIVLIVLVAVVIVLIALSIAFAIGISQPLDRLAYRMMLTASLQDEADDDDTSILSEIADMQSQYVLMKQELNRIKSYLPQSLLQGAQYDEDDDEGDVMDVSGRTGSDVTSGVGSRSVGSSSAPSHSETLSCSSHASKVFKNGGVGGTAKGLNTSTQVTRKRVSVLVINIRGMVAENENAPMGDALRRLERYTTMVVQHVRDQKGVMDFFQGGFYVATFNAVNNIQAQHKRAAAAALGIRKEFDAVGVCAAMGASSSMALVGNMGCESMKRFVVLGRCYQEAILMAQMAKEHTAPTHDVSSKVRPASMLLVTSSMFDDIALEMYLQIVDIVPIGSKPASSKNNNTFQLIASVEGLKNVQENEWMYMLKEGDAKDPFGITNEAMVAAYEGKSVVELQSLLSNRSTPPVDAAATVNAGDSDTQHTVDALAATTLTRIVEAGNLAAYLKERFGEYWCSLNKPQTK